MKLWLINPFDPLPGEREQLGRYAYLARCLQRAGHDVMWWSSAFSHRFKRFLDETRVRDGARDWGIDVRLIDVPPYTRNVSLKRIHNHRLFGKRFYQQARAEAPPDIILASSPPLEAAAHAMRLARDWSIPGIVDIQDQWPDNFVKVGPAAARPFARLLLAPLYRTERKAYQAASGIVGVAQGYVDRGLHVGGQKRWTGEFPLGVDIEDVRDAAKRGAEDAADKWQKPEGQLWLIYSGSLSYAYDFLTIVRAAVPVQERFGDRVRFIITGQGELAPQAEAIVREHNLRNVTITGFLDFPEWAYLLSQVDAGFNASFPDALIYLPNKIFYYLAAGAAVLNTIPGECAQIVSQSGCGLNYTAGDVESCAAAIAQLVEQPDKRDAMQAASKRLAEEKFARHIVYADYVRFLEQVATSG